jgi:hypothetical protein
MSNRHDGLGTATTGTGDCLHDCYYDRRIGTVVVVSGVDCTDHGSII